MYADDDNQEQTEREPLIVVVSPYHLTTRQPPALVGPLLADHVVTMMPTPSRAEYGRDEARRVVMDVPKYLRFMESWRWSTPLWDAGIIAPVFDGEDAIHDVREALELINRDETLRPLRPFMRQELFGDERKYLETVAADILKGGPDPAISIPVAAGLDRFGASNVLAVLRSEAASVAQRAEPHLWRKLFAMVIPMVVQADGDSLLRIRQLLDPCLESLRGGLAMACGQVVHEGADAMDEGIEGQIVEAAGAFAADFEDLRPEIESAADDDEVRIVCAPVNITAVAMPADTVLRSSLAAVGTLGGKVKHEKSSGENLPAVWDPASGRTVFSLVVRQIGAGTAMGRRKALGRG